MSLYSRLCSLYLPDLSKLMQKFKSRIPVQNVRVKVYANVFVCKLLCLWCLMGPGERSRNDFEGPSVAPCAVG